MLNILVYFLSVAAGLAFIFCLKRFIPFGLVLKEYEERYHRPDSCSTPSLPPPEFTVRHDCVRDKFFLSLRLLSLISALLFATLFVKIYFTEKLTFLSLICQIDLAAFIYFTADCFFIGGEIGRLGHQCKECAQDKAKTEWREKKIGTLKKERRCKFFACVCTVIIFTVLCRFF